MYAYKSGSNWAVQLILFDEEDDRKGIATQVMLALLARV